MLDKKNLIELAKVTAGAQPSSKVAYSFGENSFSYSDLNETLRAELREIAGTYALYNQGYSSIKIHLELGCDRTTVLNVLRANGLKSRGRSKRIEQLDLDGNYIQTFDSIKEAGTWLIEQGVTSFINCHKAIYQVCINNRKNAIMIVENLIKNKGIEDVVISITNENGKIISKTANSALILYRYLRIK